MSLYSYVVAHDTGFSPNPFFGYCTLACCKPTIRRTVKVGDWIVGLSPKSADNRMVYFMRVDQKITFDRYWSDPRFRDKRPGFGVLVRKRGDNIYEPLPGGGYRQLAPSMHSKGRKEDPEKKTHDLKGKFVLVSQTFAYLGSAARKLPEGLAVLRVRRGHKCRFSADVVAKFEQYANRIRLGVHGSPSIWTKDDASWKHGCGGSNDHSTT